MIYIDAILHIANLNTLLASYDFSEAPHTQPVLGSDGSALVFVRLTEEQVSLWRGTPGVTVLAEAKYGPKSVEIIYAAVWTNPVTAKLYDTIYPPTDGVRAMFGYLG